MCFDARTVFALQDAYCVRSSAAHAISINRMRTRVCSIRFAREVPVTKEKVSLRPLLPVASSFFLTLAIVCDCCHNIMI